MNGKTNTTDTIRGLRGTVLFALIAALLNLVLNLYHFSLQGTGGLYTWHPLLVLRIILFMGLGPLLSAVLYLFVVRQGPTWLRAGLRWLSLLVSGVVSLVSLALLGYLILVPRLGNLETPRLSLINPSQGIEPLVHAAEASQASAGVKGQDLSGQGASSPGTEAAAFAAHAPLLKLSFSSDPHWGAETSNAEARSQILQQIARHGSDAFFMLGDTVETGNGVEQWNAALADLSKYIPQVPLRVLLGNHDALFGGQYLYKKVFFPSGFSSNSGSPFYYSMNARYATIIVLNLPWGTENFGNTQRRWLEKTLAQADHAKPIIVLSHSYFYASGYDDPANGSPWYDHYQNIAEVVPLLEQYKVDLVISGHNHYQELLSHNGVTYAIVG
ncbi:MAG TPA: metallophosphoesterase, partial [Treponema sp.]|nr:metallophosphoesterase [Treponema sp.]